MQEREVPQEGNATLGGHRKAMYARGSDGRIRIVESCGWEVEEIVTRQAVQEYDRMAAQAHAQMQTGQASPLLYHMYRARMDVPLLAQATGLWRWRVRRHLRTAVFSRLPSATLALYAQALGVSAADLASHAP